MPDITYDVGRVSFVMKGAWNLATSYEKLDAVSYNGSLYIAKQDVPGGTAITNTTYWQLAAEKGDKGDTGGVDSVNGQQGDVWFPDSRQLISDGYTTDTAPFLMKGNGSDSDRFELAKKLGNTVCVNQQVYPLNSTAWRANNSTVSFSDGVASFTATARYGGIIPSVNQYRPSVVNGHIYLFIGSIQKTTATAEVGFSVNVGSTYYLNTTAGTGWQTLTAIYTASTTGLGQITCQDNSVSDWTENKTKDIWLIDLTLWHGSNDRIPSDLLSHPENWGRYYAGSLDYNAGTLESADGSVLTSISRNCFDGELESGSYNPSTGAKITNANAVRSKNLIPCIPNETYYFRSATALPAQVFYVVFFDAQGNFVGANINGYYNATKTIPANAHFMGFWAGSASYPVTDTSRKFTISLYYSGESGYDEDYDYSVLAEVDTGSEVLRGDGTPEHSDSKLPDGTISWKRITYTITGNEPVIAWYDNTSAVYGHHYGGAIQIPNLGIAYGADTYGNASNGYLIEYANNNKTIYASLPTRLDILDDSYTTQAAWLAGITGTVLILDVATPTTEQGTAFDPLVVTVKNGVLSWTNTKGIPVGQESHYFENLRKRVEDRLPDPPSADGTYRLTCTISGGVKTYSWEA